MLMWQSSTEWKDGIQAPQAKDTTAVLLLVLELNLNEGGSERINVKSNRSKVCRKTEIR